MIIVLPDGRTAVAVEVGPDVAGDELLAALDLPPPRATVVVNGSTITLGPALASAVAEAFGPTGLAALAAREGLTVVTGGTDAGIFAVLGRALARGRAPIIGVVPAGLVAWPERPGPGVVLEANHTHFVLVEGREWGDETPAMLALAGALGRTAPSVAVICGGGPLTGEEVAGHLRDGRPIVVLAGSGRVADELAEVAGAGGEPRITVCPLVAGGPALAGAVKGALGLW